MDKLSFVEWAKGAYTKNKEIVEQWEKGPDPFNRALAKTILEAAGGATHAN